MRTHKKLLYLQSDGIVVNWFQIVFLREDSQVYFSTKVVSSCCELISNCIFTWGLTSGTISTLWVFRLWIDFKLYFYVRTHKTEKSEDEMIDVVNWFQIVFLREDSQVPQSIPRVYTSCELISNCIFTWGLTSRFLTSIGIKRLWIDFKLYFYVRTHKVVLKFKDIKLVVNWFQIVFLREDSQECNNLV